MNIQVYSLLIAGNGANAIIDRLNRALTCSFKAFLAGLLGAAERDAILFEKFSVPQYPQAILFWRQDFRHLTNQLPVCEKYWLAGRHAGHDERVGAGLYRCQSYGLGCVVVIPPGLDGE